MFGGIEIDVIFSPIPDAIPIPPVPRRKNNASSLFFRCRSRRLSGSVRLLLKVRLIRSHDDWVEYPSSWVDVMREAKGICTRDSMERESGVGVFDCTRGCAVCGTMRAVRTDAWGEWLCGCWGRQLWLARVRFLRLCLRERIGVQALPKQKRICGRLEDEEKAETIANVEKQPSTLEAPCIGCSTQGDVGYLVLTANDSLQKHWIECPFVAVANLVFINSTPREALEGDPLRTPTKGGLERRQHAYIHDRESTSDFKRLRKQRQYACIILETFYELVTAVKSRGAVHYDTIEGRERM